MVEYDTPTLADIAIVAANMRYADRQEAEAMAAMGPEEALLRSVELSHEAVVARVGGEPVCIYGLGVGSMLSGMARPWLMGTDVIDHHCITFLRANRLVVRGWSKRYDLENFVDARHTKAIRWLGWLGFKLDAPEPFGPFGMPFHRFQMPRIGG
jgi:hypothetical protein